MNRMLVMDVKGHSGEVSDRTQEQVIKTGGKVILITSGRELGRTVFQCFLEDRTQEQ